MQKYTWFLGCPEWGNAYWSRNFFRPKSRPDTYLAQYADVFNTVEGNTTFYGIPRPETLRRWRDSVPESFRFCFKFPRIISHERRLQDVQAPLEDFLAALDELRDRLGPTFLQLSPTFGAAEFDVLEDFLRRLPQHLRYCLELRHQDYFDRGDVEAALDEVLGELNIDRVFFDSRVLHASRVQDEDTRVAKSRKPKIPQRTQVIARHPFLRFIGSNDPAESEHALREWAGRTAAWMKAGLEPYIFIHTPNDHHAPALARSFHGMVRELLPDLPGLAEFPIERAGPQMETPSLFDQD